MSIFPALFAPFALRGLTLRNRIAMAPMTREFAPGGVPDAAVAAYYRRRAAGGTALIITEGTPPDPVGRFSDRVPRFYGDDALAGWARVVEAVHAEGAAIFAQLWHVGAFDPELVGMRNALEPPVERLSPSGLAGPGRPLGRAMSAVDIAATIEAYAIAAANARRLGFDGVEIHGAHGYLPDQFLWAPTNERRDGYGGAPEARLRFVLELVAACRARTSASFPIALRLSQWKQLDYAARIATTPDELARLVRPLAAAGVDLFHCSTRRYWEPAFEDSPLGLAAWVKRLSGKPSIAVGSVTLGNDFKSARGKESATVAPEQLEDLERRVAAGEFDLVAIGRALLANPDWARRVAGGEAARLRPFTKACLDALD